VPEGVCEPKIKRPRGKAAQSLPAGKVITAVRLVIGLSKLAFSAFCSKAHRQFFQAPRCALGRPLPITLV
jgi:hypothetical protein